MSELKDRVRMIRDEAGMTRAAFAAKIGYKSQDAVYFVESGIRGVSDAAAREICRQFSVREEWLRTGVGEMHRDLTPAMEAADRVRRLLVDAPSSTAGVVISTLVELDPAGPEWAAIGSVLRRITEKMK